MFISMNCHVLILILKKYEILIINHYSKKLFTSTT